MSRHLMDYEVLKFLPQDLISKILVFQIYEDYRFEHILDTYIWHILDNIYLTHTREHVSLIIHWWYCTQMTQVQIPYHIWNPGRCQCDLSTEPKECPEPSMAKKQTKKEDGVSTVSSNLVQECKLFKINTWISYCDTDLSQKMWTFLVNDKSGYSGKLLFKYMRSTVQVSDIKMRKMFELRSFFKKFWGN